MEAAGSPPTNWRQRFKRPTLKGVVVSAAVGAAAAAGWWRVVDVPAQALLRKRYESTLDIVKMYGLQLSYKRAKGTYANDLASLLSVDPDGAALQANLAANVDMSTLAVDGDARKFKIELNVLDPERTLIKIQGPIPRRARAAAAPMALPMQAPAVDADGAPISSGR
jgi:hypothetical protein